MRFLVTAILILTFMSSCAVWRWNECRMVGHSPLYCVGVVVSK